MDCVTADFPDPGVPKAVPYGVFDRKEQGCGSMSVTIADARRSLLPRLNGGENEWAVSDIRTPRSLMITADAGGSNSYRSRMFQSPNYRLNWRATIRLIITVCHVPTRDVGGSGARSNTACSASYR
jgi:hypothetical protein